MNTRPVSLATLCKLLPACLLFFLGSTTSLLAKTGEQLNWYLHNSWNWSSHDLYAIRIAAFKDPETNRTNIYAIQQSNNDEIFVYDLNGSLKNTISVTLNNPSDITIDKSGNIYIVNNFDILCLDNHGVFKWRVGKSTDEISVGVKGNGEAEFDYANSLAIDSEGLLFISDSYNKRIQVLDKNGNYIRHFGNPKDPQNPSPSDLNYPTDIVISKIDEVIILEGSYLKVFKKSGEFIKRIPGLNDYYENNLALFPDGTLITGDIVRDEEGNALFVLPGGSGSTSKDLVFLEGCGDFVWAPSKWYRNQPFHHYKSVYRTKGLPEPNSPPHPAVHSIVQRSGTNLIDIDFEIIDADDDTATVGMIAAVNGSFDNPTQWIIPDALVEGTESKIGQPIATNQTHRVTWSVKGDWSELYGNLQVGLFAQDARRDKPVDIHFLELPLEEGNMTISRSPVKDTDMVNYFQFLLATGSTELALENGQITDGNGTALVNASLQTTSSGRKAFIDALGLGYRWAGIAELAHAQEAATLGKTNVWDATNRVVPRNLPEKVNEYGFDVGSHGDRAWWVIKESSWNIPEFSFKSFDNESAASTSFGNSVAISGDNLVVGSSESLGIPLLFSLQGDEMALSSPVVLPVNGQLHEYGNFGSNPEAIEMENGILAVGQPNFHYSGLLLGSGCVGIFDLSSEVPTSSQILTPDEPINNAGFGTSVDVYGDFLVAGAPKSKYFVPESGEAPQNAGLAYLFKRGPDGQYNQIGKLRPSNSSYIQWFGFFGNSVAVSEEWVAVGASNEDLGHEDYSGAVYIYKVSSTGSVAQTDRIFSNWSNEPDYSFGTQVKLSGNWLAVTSINNNVHLFKINAEGKAEHMCSLPHSYGISDIDLDGNRLIVGMSSANAEGINNSGMAHIYELYEDGRSLLLAALTHPEPRENDAFGFSVGISGQNIVVGVPNRDLDSYRWDAGGAVFFRASE